MPPYAISQQEVFDDTMGLHNSYSDDPMEDVPLGSKISGEEDDEVHNDSNNNTILIDESMETDSLDEKNSSFLEKLLDFNPCAQISLVSLPNPSSALFKQRLCAECGKNCTKMQGYSKEVLERTTIADEDTGEESTVQDKIYFHEWCAKIRGYRSTHKDSYEAVLRNLLDYFRALEFEKQVKREAEEKRRRHQYQLVEKAARNAPLEVNLVEKKKKSGFWKRAGNQVKTTFSIESCMGLMGTTKAVDDTMEASSF